MKRLLLLFMLLSLLASAACDSSESPSPGGHQQNEQEPVEVIIPPLTDIGREPVFFSDIIYTRPDADLLIKELSLVSEGVKSRSIDYDSLIARIEEADGMYDNFSTMLSLILLRSSADITDTVLAEEYELLSGKSPAIAQAVEELFVAIAASDFVSRLESEEFGAGFFDEYKDGSKYTDTVVALLEKEAKFESDYLAISPATVMIKFEGATDSYENTLTRVQKKYASNKVKLNNALAECERLYIKESEKLSESIYIELLKTRSLLAEAYGYDSYTQYAYEILGHDYSTEEADALMSDIAEYAIPVYLSLTDSVFAGYFKTHRAPHVQRGQVINNVYNAMSKLDGDIGAAYSYMLNCGLYDAKHYSDSRRDASFTLYLDNFDAPFVFATLSGNAGDYMTVTHEFGHFYDNLVNGSSSASLDIIEVSSQALEFLALTEMEHLLSADEYQYLYFSKMQDALEVLIFQGFYAKFESMVYELSYDEITADAVNALVKEAASFMKLHTDYFNKVSDILIIHLIDTPFYVQSYCTSLMVSLDIYFTECDSEGKGTALYKALLERDGSDGFSDNLQKSAIPSPFREGGLTEILDKIYYSIIGSHYYGGSEDIVNAA